MEYNWDLWAKDGRAMRSLCFYENMGNKVNLLLLILFLHLCHFVHVKNNTNYFENGVESTSRTRRMKGGLKMGDR